MYRVTIHCDICGKTLPIEQVTTQVGTFYVVKVGKTEICNTKHLFKHLCKECALMIDNELLKFKLDLLEKRG